MEEGIKLKEKNLGEKECMEKGKENEQERRRNMEKKRNMGWGLEIDMRYEKKIEGGKTKGYEEEQECSLQERGKGKRVILGKGGKRETRSRKKGGITIS